MIDTESEPGAWAKALPYCQNIRITEHPGDTHPLPAPGNCAATPDNPGVAAPLCDDLLHTQG